MRINALLSGLPAASVVRSGGIGLPQPQVDREGTASSSNAEDRFEQGKWWRNMAKAAGPASEVSGRQCNCGNCPACAAKAYQVQGSAAPGQNPASEVEPTQVTPVSASEVPADAGRGEEDIEKVEMGTKGLNGEVLSQAEQMEVAALQQVDTKVKAHEMAHLAAAGSYARGGANFSYWKGPDGNSYAVGGEVSIDTSKEATPEATMGKMQTVRSAALAPADPSPQDRKVAAKAAMVITEASQELQMIRLEQAKSGVGQGGNPNSVDPAQDKPGDPVVATSSGLSPTPTAGQKAAVAALAGLSRPIAQFDFSA